MVYSSSDGEGWAITCHVLDITIGRPARGIPVRLQGPEQNDQFESRTDDDGRIKAWKAIGGDQHTAGRRPDHALAGLKGPSTWKLIFDIEAYYGAGQAFFPEAVIAFCIDAVPQRYHLAVLLSPHSYTTYRGS